MFERIKNEILSFSSSERIFLFCAMLCGFCICAGYAIVRPVSDAIFITAYGSGMFPYAWLAVIPLNLGVVSLYNRFLPLMGCWKMFLATISTICAINLLAAFFLPTFSAFPFLFYIWKEVFVLMLFQQLWSVIHSTLSIERAKYLYGLLFAVGAAGGILGSSIPGFLAVKMGSENLLFTTLPIYGGLAAAYFIFLKHSRAAPAINSTPEAASFREGWRLIASSKTLTFILLIVVLMQLVATLSYYQFNSILEATIGDKDIRTQYVGRIGGAINIANLSLQLIGSFVLVHFLGLRRSHLLIPAILGCNALASLFYPTFGMLSYSYVTIKSFDFSIFGVIKEMLYIPLKREEKFQAKAVIDVFAYRTAKAGGSLLILAIQMIHAPQIIPALSIGSALLFSFWIWIVFRLLKLQEPSYDRVA